MVCLGPSRLGSLSAVGRMAHNAVRAAVTFFDDVAELVLCEEKGTQVELGVGLKPSFSQKLVVHWCFLMKAAPWTAA